MTFGLGIRFHIRCHLNMKLNMSNLKAFSQAPQYQSYLPDGVGYSFLPINDVWSDPTYGSPAFEFGSYADTLQPTPSEANFSECPWTPSTKPLRSPLSETPSCVLTSRSGSTESWPNAARTGPTTYSEPSHLTTHQPNPPPAPVEEAPPKPSKHKRKRDESQTLSTTRLAKKPHTPNPPDSSRPTTPLISVPASSISTPSTNIRSPTTLGGVLPANVDPRLASEQIKRQAWERCRAEAQEMSQRRLMLLDHEKGALEREVEKLRVNLGLMREREQERGETGGGEGHGEGGGRKAGGW